jgi:hypothetical protein
MMCSMLSREKAHPALLITSAGGTPEWVSSFEALKLAVGMCDFTCCQRNHTFPGIGVVPCDRDITREILETMIASKVEHLYKTHQIKLARLFHCMTQWWTRRPSPSTLVKRCESLVDLKRQLKWDESIDGQDTTSPWTDRCDISILAYGVAVNEVNVVREILNLFENQIPQLLAWRFPKKGVVEVGIPGLSTCLYGAMCFASPEIVVALLDAGAGTETTDIMGNDPLIAACGIGRLDNVKTWFAKFKHWKVDRQNAKFGSTALHVAVYMGPKKLDLVKYLVRPFFLVLFLTILHQLIHQIHRYMTKRPIFISQTRAEHLL